MTIRVKNILHISDYKRLINNTHDTKTQDTPLARRPATPSATTHTTPLCPIFHLSLLLYINSLSHSSLVTLVADCERCKDARRYWKPFYNTFRSYSLQEMKRRIRDLRFKIHNCSHCNATFVFEHELSDHQIRLNHIGKYNAIRNPSNFIEYNDQHVASIQLKKKTHKRDEILRFKKWNSRYIHACLHYLKHHSYEWILQIPLPEKYFDYHDVRIGLQNILIETPNEFDRYERARNFLFRRHYQLFE